MHGYHRRRSPMKLVIWCGAFLSLSLVLAWRFDWLPGGGEGESPVEPNSEVVGDDVAARGRAGAARSGDSPFDASVFQHQHEPGDNERDVSMPKNFGAPTSAGATAGFPDNPPRKTGGTAASLTRHDDGRGRVPSEMRFSRYGSPDGGNRVAANTTTPRAPSRGTSPIRQTGFQNGAADDSAPPPETLQKIDVLIRAGETRAAHKELSQIYWKKPQWRNAIRQRIEQTAKQIFFDRDRHFMPAYVVQPGDQLRTIAKKYKLTYQYLERLNGVNARQIRPGTKLKVLNGPFAAVVDLKNRELTVHYHGYFVAKYPVGIGRDGKTPLGKHRIDDKLINPTYTHTDERTGRQTRIRFGDPANPLGTRWLSIGRSFGIHGTNDPHSIGKAESAGCVRMRNADAEWVYDFLIVGSEVIIQR
jgi:lipoprotein-anchoring transpeptidase ErfK/SrfK